MALKVFIDCEFTNFPPAAHRLISLGLAAETGDEFYVEVAFEMADCSDFVKEVVIPLLGQIPHAQVPLAEARGRILDWCQRVRQGEDVVICYDSEYDWNLLVGALDCQVPAWIQKRYIGGNINELFRYAYHKKSGRPEHHALFDACGNRAGYRQRAVGPLSPFQP